VVHIGTLVLLDSLYGACVESMGPYPPGILMWWIPGV
jgi:hypothetical protein